MRYEKAVYAPEENYFFERVDLSRLKDGQTAVFRHLRPTAAGYVCAEGRERLVTLPATATRLYALDGEVYAYLPAQGGLYCLSTGTTITGVDHEPIALLPHVTREGTSGLYCVERETLRYIRAGAVRASYPIASDCAAMHHGRLFTAKGTRLSFSAPYSETGVTQTERDPDKAGYIDFDGERGKIIALVSYRERLYVFFERGILRLRAEGEAIDFAATELPFAGGKALEGSVAHCGEKVCYMTSDGLYAFDGGCDFLEKCGELDLSQPIGAYAYNGSYAAAVSLKSGEIGIYVYDFREKAGRLLCGRGIIAGDRDLLLEAGSISRLTEEGGLPDGQACSLEVTLSAWPRTLLWLRLEGEGSYRITLGDGKILHAEGGARLRIGEKTPRSFLQMTLTPEGDDFRIRAIDIGWRREDGN